MADIKLYPHNQETYTKIQQIWETTNRVAAIQATGTGKSFLILKCLFDIPNDNKVVLAPTEYIFEQLQENVIENIPNTQFITYSKLSYMANDEIKLLNPTLIVLDEFHRCGAEEWGKGVQTLLNTFPDVKVLGTSATPIRYLDNERDMSDELFNGNVAVNLPLTEAIVKGILPMPKYISALYTFEDEVENLKHKVITSHNSEEEKEELFKQIDLMRNKLDRSKGIPKIFKKHLTQSSGKFIVFCKNKEHLYEMKSTVVSWFKKAKLGNKIESYIVYTGYKNTDQDFEAFKNNDNDDSLKLLFSIEMLNEGLHIDDITGVILLRPTVSPIIYYQQIGRAIDAGNNKQPLIFDFVNNFDNLGATQFISDLNEYREKEIKNRKEYAKRENVDIPEFIIYDEILEVKDIFNGLENKLHEHGDWEAWYIKIKEYYLKNGNVNIPKKEILGAWLHRQRVQYKQGLLQEDKIDKLNKINIVWEPYNENWEYMYNLLLDYNKEYGDINVPRNCIYKNQNLGGWVGVQRVNKNKNQLLQEREEKLNKLNFVWHTYNEKWDYMYSLLCDYQSEYGNCLINKNTIYKNEELGKWVYNLRSDINKGGRFTKDKLNKLNKIGFIWNANDYKWDIMCNEIKDYYKENNNYKIPANYIAKNGLNLYVWALKQKKNYMNNKLSIDKINKLNKIGFTWEIEDAWENNYNKLKDYKMENNHVNVPIHYIVDGFKLGRWVSYLRNCFKNNILSQEQINKLNEIDFQWSIRKSNHDITPTHQG